MADIFDPSLDNVEVEVPHNRIKRNEEVNLTAWDPSMKNLLIGVGWELLAFDGNPIDLDVSCFLLNKNEKTRVDSDFVFYNNTEGCNRAVIHNGDNRTGAGDGDDETIYIKLKDTEPGAYTFNPLTYLYLILKNMASNMNSVY